MIDALETPCRPNQLFSPNPRQNPHLRRLRPFLAPISRMADGFSLEFEVLPAIFLTYSCNHHRNRPRSRWRDVCHPDHKRVWVRGGSLFSDTYAASPQAPATSEGALESR